MTDEEALIRGICETPNCDASRLVYADWLEERGRAERAEFIRLQCQITSMGTISIKTARRFASGDIVDPYGETSAIAAKTAQLLSEYATSWCSRDGIDPATAWEWGWSRGLISEVPCTLAEFMDHRCWGCKGSGKPFVPIQDVTGAIRHEHVQCNRCDGTGTLPGLACTLFGTHPITSVVLTDVSPLFDTSTGERLFWWLAGVGGIPNSLFAWLPRGVRNGFRWRTEREALLALGTAAVNYARKLHGYTPLPSPVEAVG